jgi:ATP-binding cassette subfamily B protein
MRRQSNSPPPPQPAQTGKPPRSDLATLKTLLPYLWVYKWRVLLALLCLIGAKLANVGVPVVLKKLVDEMSVTPAHPRAMLILGTLSLSVGDAGGDMGRKVPYLPGKGR